MVQTQRQRESFTQAESLRVELMGVLALLEVTFNSTKSFSAAMEVPEKCYPEFSLDLQDFTKKNPKNQANHKATLILKLQICRPTVRRKRQERKKILHVCFPSYLWPHSSSKPWREAELPSKGLSPWQQHWWPAQLVLDRTLLDRHLWWLTPHHRCFSHLGGTQN